VELASAWEAILSRLSDRELEQISGLLATGKLSNARRIARLLRREAVITPSVSEEDPLATLLGEVLRTEPVMLPIDRR